MITFIFDKNGTCDGWNNAIFQLIIYYFTNYYIIDRIYRPVSNGLVEKEMLIKLPPTHFSALLCWSQLNGKCTKDVSLVFTSKTRDKWDRTKNDRKRIEIS